MRTRQPVLSLLIDSWDSGDNWGSATTAAFAVCDVAGAAGAYGVWDALEYTPGLSAPADLHDLANDLDDDGVDYSTMLVAGAYLAGDIDDASLLLAARILSRYLDACRAAGLAY